MGNHISKYEDCSKKNQRIIVTEVNELNYIICNISKLSLRFANTRYEHYVTNLKVAEDAEETKRREDQRDLTEIRHDFNQRQRSCAFIKEYKKALSSTLDQNFVLEAHLNQQSTTKEPFLN
jgi:hypothetical protein